MREATKRITAGRIAEVTESLEELRCPHCGKLLGRVSFIPPFTFESKCGNQRCPSQTSEARGMFTVQFQ